MVFENGEKLRKAAETGAENVNFEKLWIVADARRVITKNRIFEKQKQGKKDRQNCGDLVTSAE